MKTSKRTQLHRTRGGLAKQFANYPPSDAVPATLCPRGDECCRNLRHQSHSSVRFYLRISDIRTARGSNPLHCFQIEAWARPNPVTTTVPVILPSQTLLPTRPSAASLPPTTPCHSSIYGNRKNEANSPVRAHAAKFLQLAEDGIAPLGL